MNILFSPSEEKLKLSSCCNIDNIKDFYINLDLENFTFKCDYRKKIILDYLDYFDNLDYIFGVKDTLNIIKNFDNKCYKAIELYQGVSYKTLDYLNLNSKSQAYIDNNVIIFSNLFGPIMASDYIPFYKLKQGIKLKNINQAKMYNNETSHILDDFLTSNIIDLRAEIYKDYYKIKKPYITFNYFKNGKQLSHNSKKYRGLTLKLLAKNNITDIKELFNMINENFSNFTVETTENITTYNIEIKD